MSRLDIQKAVFVNSLMCARFFRISSLLRMPQNAGTRPTALYGSIILVFLSAMPTPFQQFRQAGKPDLRIHDYSPLATVRLALARRNSRLQRIRK